MIVFAVAIIVAEKITTCPWSRPKRPKFQGCSFGLKVEKLMKMLDDYVHRMAFNVAFSASSFMNGKYAVRDDVTLGHMSREILYNVTAEFAESGNKIQELKEFVTTVPNVGKGQLRTERSFGFAVNSFLRGVRKELASLEHDIVSKGKLRTILEFKLEMKYLFSNVDLVYDVHKACITAIENGPLPPNDRVVHILETLFTTVCRLDASGHAGAPQVSVMLPILLETLRPLLNDLASWITHGRLPPTGSDQFFVYEDENLSQEDSEAWKNRFRLRHRWDDEKRLAVPQFLEEMAGKVLLTGKSCRILDQAVNNVAEQRTSDFEEEFFENLFDGLGMSWEKDAAKQTVEYADDLVLSKELSFSECKTHRLLVENFVVVFQRNFERFTRGVGDVSNHSNFIQKFIQQREVQLAERNSCGNPFRLTFNSSLHLLINSRYTQASRALLDLLTVRFRFDDNFNTLKNFFLMGAGDVLNEFYSEIFAKIRVKEYWQSTSYLTSVLQDALQTRFPHLVNKLTVGIQTDPRAVSNANPSSIQSVNVIYLRYSMKWPLNIIFDSKAEEKYNEVFSFLLQVKRAMWSLEQLRINELGKETNNSQKQSNPVDYSRQQQSPAISRQKMFFLRMRLLHFVHSFHTYIMTRILHSSGLEFKAKLSEAKDFEEILMFHQEFLENVHDRCLLSPKVGFAKEAITRILNLSLNFQRHWDLGLENIRHDDLQAIGTEFDKCSHFIQSFLNNLIKRGSFPHLELLSLSLEM